MARTPPHRVAILSDRSGTAIMEFALLLPLLVFLFAGAYQINDALAVRAKVTATARTVVDLTSRFSTVDDRDLQMIFNASTQMMAPVSATPLQITLTQIRIDANGLASVDWSRTKSGPPIAAGTPVALAQGLRQPDTWLLRATVAYAYRPIAVFGFSRTITLTDTIIMSPRLSAAVKKL